MRKLDDLTPEEEEEAAKRRQAQNAKAAVLWAKRAEEDAAYNKDMAQRRLEGVPQWMDQYNALLKDKSWAHQQREYGGQMDRAWNSDEGAQRVKTELDNKYKAELDAYNKKNGTNYAPDSRAMGVNAQPNDWNHKQNSNNGFLADSLNHAGDVIGSHAAKVDDGLGISHGADVLSSEASKVVERPWDAGLVGFAVDPIGYARKQATYKNEAVQAAALAAAMYFTGGAASAALGGTGTVAGGAAAGAATAVGAGGVQRAVNKQPVFDGQAMLRNAGTGAVTGGVGAGVGQLTNGLSTGLGPAADTGLKAGVGTTVKGLASGQNLDTALTNGVRSGVTSGVSTEVSDLTKGTGAAIGLDDKYAGMVDKTLAGAGTDIAMGRDPSKALTNAATSALTTGAGDLASAGFKKAGLDGIRIEGVNIPGVTLSGNIIPGVDAATVKKILPSLGPDGKRLVDVANVLKKPSLTGIAALTNTGATTKKPVAKQPPAAVLNVSKKPAGTSVSLAQPPSAVMAAYNKRKA